MKTKINTKSFNLQNIKQQNNHNKSTGFSATFNCKPIYFYQKVKTKLNHQTFKFPKY